MRSKGPGSAVEIKCNKYLDSLGMKVRLAPSVGGTGEEWEHRKDSYSKILGNENVYYPNKIWFGEDSETLFQNIDYVENLINHRIFIVSGVSNVTYDILSRGGMVILMFFDKFKDNSKFPWWKCKEREVHNHVKKYPGIHVCHNANEIEDTIKSNYPEQNFQSFTPYSEPIESSKIIFDLLTSQER